MPASNHRYMVKEMFGPTLQGEGGMTGVVCHFLRLSGCNMWDGRDETREASKCPFCDTQFRGGRRMTSSEIVDSLLALPPARWVTVTGGEPMLQFDEELAEALSLHWKIAIETNGTKVIPPEISKLIDHLTLSPKLPFDQTVVRRCDSLKLLYPHPNPLIRPEAYLDIAAGARYLQPITPLDGRAIGPHIQLAVDRLTTDLIDWRLSLQIHQIIGVR